VGKIFDALQLYDDEAKRRRADDKLRTTDYYALLKYDRHSGILDLSDSVVKAQDAIQRLVKCGLIEHGGRLTPKGLNACKRFRKMQAAKGGSPSPNKGVANAAEPMLDSAKAAGTEATPPPENSSADQPLPRREAQRPVAIVRNQEAPEGPAEPAIGSTAGIDHDLVILHKPYSVEAEQFRKLRSAIMFRKSASPPRLILVTSTAPGEGKSFVAANLAATIALNPDRHVLLVDSDLRDPSIHRLLGLSNRAGLSDHLDNQQDLASLIHPAVLPRMSVVSAGPRTPNPSELLTSETMFRFLDEVRDRYDDRLVVLDSPPATVAAELSVLAGFADGILLVIKEGGPKREEVLAVVEQLGKKKFLGIVGNFTSERSSGYYYRNKHYRRYYQGESA
jgi:capsular exopolysaccharide synthesis family protein